MSASDRYTNEALEADLKSTGMINNGARNSAPYLLKLDTPERRLRAVQEAHTLSNLIGYRYSEAVYAAVKDLQNKIANGQEDQPLYGEATARRYREQEEELRKATRGY